MELNKYQERALETAIYPEAIKEIFQESDLDKEFGPLPNVAEAIMLLRLNYAALGLAGEAGEFAGKISKLTRDRTGHDQGYLRGGTRAMLGLELGDALWFVADAAKELGFTLDEIAVMNLRQLAQRKEEGKIGGSGDER